MTRTQIYSQESSCVSDSPMKIVSNVCGLLATIKNCQLSECGYSISKTLRLIE